MTRRSAAGLGAALVSLGLTITSTPAVAAPVFDDSVGTLSASSGLTATGAGCTQDSVPPPASQLPLTENGAPSTVSSQSTGSAHGTAPTDRVSASASASVTGSLTSASGLPRSFDMRVVGQATISSQQPTSACSTLVYAGGQIAFTFTLAQPAWLHLEMSADRFLYNDVTLYRLDDENYYASVNGRGFRSERDYRYLLPAGKYQGTVLGRIELGGLQTPTVSSTGTVHGGFTVPGSQTAPAAGKALHYLTLPAAASCATHTVDPVVTKKRKRLANVKQVEFFLDDVRVARVKHPKKGKVVPLPVAAGQASALSVEVTLKPTGAGKKPRTLSATAGYEACP